MVQKVCRIPYTDLTGGPTARPMRPSNAPGSNSEFPSCRIVAAAAASSMALTGADPCRQRRRFAADGIQLFRSFLAAAIQHALIRTFCHPLAGGCLFVCPAARNAMKQCQKQRW